MASDKALAYYRHIGEIQCDRLRLAIRCLAVNLYAGGLYWTGPKR